MMDLVKPCLHGNSPVMEQRDDKGYLFKVFCQGCGRTLEHFSFVGEQVDDWNSAVGEGSLIEGSNA